MTSTNNVRALRRRRAEAGLCVHCGVSPSPTTGANKRCQDCLVKTRAYTKSRNQHMRNERDKRVAAGMCMYCGKNPAEHGKRCTHCRDRDNRKHRAWLAETTASRVAAGLCKSCGTQPIAKRSTSRCNACMAKEASCENPTKQKRKTVYAREYSRRLRNEVLEHYSDGTPVCNCCGESEYTFLTIDHVNNDGAAHRNAFGVSGGVPLYRFIIKNNFPATFQILCHNCNHGKHLNGGICPHQQWVASITRNRSNSG